MSLKSFKLILFLIASLISFDNWANIQKEQIQSNSLNQHSTNQDFENKKNSDLESKKPIETLLLINKKLQKANIEKSKNLRKILNTEAEYINLQKKISELEIKIQKQKKTLRHRLSSLDILNEGAFLFFLTKEISFAELENNIKKLSLVAENDLNEIRLYILNKNLLNSQKNKLKRMLDQLYDLKQQQINHELSLSKTFKNQNKVVNKILKNKQLSSYLNEKILSKDQFKDIGAFDKITSNNESIFIFKSQLNPPVIGTILQKFGVQKLEEEHLNLLSKGIYFETNPNEEVRSIYHGRVVFIKLIEGRGLTVILDHGEHFYSIYSGLSFSNMNLSDSIGKGDKIGNAGFSSLLRTNGIYLELRHFTEPQDPLAWIQGASNEVVK